MKNKNKWIHLRHKIITFIAYFLITPYIYFRYGLKIEKFCGDRKRQYLIIMNHQTGLDQFFVGIAMRKTVYFIASEDLFSNGFISKLLRWAVAPIPIKKQVFDISAVRTCLRVVKEGGSIALAPEGNRTYCGKTGYVKPSIVKLIKKLGLPLAVLRIEGGYGVQPRWSDVVRKGKMRVYISKIIEPSEYLEMSNDELFDIVYNEMYVDETKLGFEYRHKKNAEFLERAMYVCNNCGLSEFYSEDDIITCKKCGQKIRHLPSKRIEGVGFDLPFEYVADWYKYQCDFINSLDVNTDKVFYTDHGALWKVNLYKNKELINNNAQIKLYSDKIVIDENIVAEFGKDTAVTVLGRNKLNIYIGDNVYQIKADKRFNALKYVNFYNHYRNVKEGEENEQFLGL